MPWIPRPDDPVTIPSDPTETSIPVPVDETDDHQLVSSGSTPLFLPPSAQLSLTINAARAVGAVVSNPPTRAKQTAATFALKSLVPKQFIRLSPKGVCNQSYSQICEIYADRRRTNPFTAIAPAINSQTEPGSGTTPPPSEVPLPDVLPKRARHSV